MAFDDYFRPIYSALETAIAGERSIGLPLPQLPRVLEVAADRLQTIPDLYRQAGLPPAVTSPIYLEGDRELLTNSFPYRK